MAIIISGQGPAGPNTLFHDITGSGLIRFERQAALPVAVINAEDITVSVSGVEVSVDDLEALQQSTIDTLNSGLAAIDANTNGLEGFAEAGNVLLTGVEGFVSGIETAVDELEGFTDGLEGFVDDLEALQASGNTLQQSTIDTLNSGLATLDTNSDGLEALIGTSNTSLAAIDANTDGLESLQTTTNDLIASGVTIKDKDSTDLLSVTPVSGGENAAFIQVDKVLNVSEIVASGSITGGTFTTPADISSQVGFYNNALFIGSSVATSIDIFVNSDGGGNYAKVGSLVFPNAGDFLYYDLRGYEARVKLRPADTSDIVVDLVLNR